MKTILKIIIVWAAAFYSGSYFLHKFLDAFRVSCFDSSPWWHFPTMAMIVLVHSIALVLGTIYAVKGKEFYKILK